MAYDDNNNPEQQRQYDNKITTAKEEESASIKAKETGQIFKELVASIGKKTKAVAEEKSRQLKEADDDKNIAMRDAADIQMLGSRIDSIITMFDSTMDTIRKQPYDEQQRLLVGLKKMLQEEVYVIDARRNMAKRLKFVESARKTKQDGVEDRVQERTTMNVTDAEAIAPPIPKESEVTTSGFARMEEEDDGDDQI